MDNELPRLPLVGRKTELALIRAALDAAEAGRGTTLLFSGVSGIGKSDSPPPRVDGQQTRWNPPRSRQPVERGVPYSLFADVLLPTFRKMTPETRALITRGAERARLAVPADLRRIR
jgi:hypothetical protein